MPIYEYRCDDCAYRGEFLQKVSDPPIKVCPECGSGQFSKLVSAAGFQLKGSGWYVTDFKNGSKPAAKSDNKSDPNSDAKSDAKSEEKPTESKSADEAKPAGSCGSACACHN
jgi:putative FmdB family regulatory protein